MGEKAKFISKDRSFYLGKNHLKLSDGFKRAEECTITLENVEKDNKRYCLKLFYDTFDLYGESANITGFLADTGLLGKLEIKAGEKSDVLWVIGQKGYLELIDPTQTFPEFLDLP
jgi:hypothetical protein